MPVACDSRSWWCATTCRHTQPYKLRYRGRHKNTHTHTHTQRQSLLSWQHLRAVPIRWNSVAQNWESPIVSRAWPRCSWHSFLLNWMHLVKAAHCCQQLIKSELLNCTFLESHKTTQCNLLHRDVFLFAWGLTALSAQIGYIAPEQ